MQLYRALSVWAKNNPYISTLVFAMWLVLTNGYWWAWCNQDLENNHPLVPLTVPWERVTSLWENEKHKTNPPSLGQLNPGNCRHINGFALIGRNMQPHPAYFRYPQPIYRSVGEKKSILIFLNMEKGKNGKAYDNFLLWLTWMETEVINQNIKILEKFSNLYLIYLTWSAFGH